MQSQPQPNEENARNLIIAGIEQNNFLWVLAGQVCLLNLKIMEQTENDQ